MLIVIFIHILIDLFFSCTAKVSFRFQFIFGNFYYAGHSTVKKYLPPSWFHVCHTSMFQIIKQILILEKDNRDNMYYNQVFTITGDLS